MPFDFAEAVNSAARWLLDMRPVRVVASGPFYTAIVLAVIIMLIAAFVFRDAETVDGLHIMAARVGFWSFIASVILLYLHYKVTTKEGQYENAKDMLSRPTMLTNDITIAPVTIKPFTES